MAQLLSNTKQLGNREPVWHKSNISPDTIYRIERPVVDRFLKKIGMPASNNMRTVRAAWLLVIS